MSGVLPINLGTVDRVVRAALGLGLLALTFTGPQTSWGYLGVIPLLTATMRSCPLYTLLGLSTCSTSKRS